MNNDLYIYHTVKKLRQIGIKNMLGGKNIGESSLYTEENQGKTKGCWIRLWQFKLISNHQISYCTVATLHVPNQCTSI